MSLPESPCSAAEPQPNRGTAILAVSVTGGRRCEIISERAKTSHAKAPRRRGAKKTKQLFLAIFASWRLGVKSSIFSQLRTPVAQRGAPPGFASAMRNAG